MPKSVPVCALFLLFFAAEGIYALDAGARTRVGTDGITVDVWAVDPPADTVMENISEGMRAEITFQIEIYRKPHGFFSIFGDRLVEDIRVTREASWSVFEQNYVIRDSDGTERRIADRNAFALDLFRLDDYTLPWSEFAADTGSGTPPDAASLEDAYILVRVSVRPMKLVPALAMLSFLRVDSEIVSGWRRLDIPSAR